MSESLCSHAERRTGFALIEVLIAMGIFTIGFISIAAPLLVAVRMQSNTIDEVQVRQVTRSAEAFLRGMDFKEAAIANELLHPSNPPSITSFDTDGKLKPFPGQYLPSVADRSYPTTQPLIDQRRYYWTLKIRDDDPTIGVYDFHVYLIVSRRADTASTEPAIQPLSIVGVASKPSDVARTRFDLANNGNLSSGNRIDKVRVGDMILDEYGGIYRAVGVSASDISLDAPVLPALKFGGVDPGELWYVEPHSDTARSPVRNIRLLSTGPMGVIQP